MEQLNTVRPVEAETSQPRDYLSREIAACTYRVIGRESSVDSTERTATYSVAMVASAIESHPPLNTEQQMLPVEF